jgi:Ni,Fe-hydrogenase III small subunit/formate hydrogenlyase subunit 6/NADH:ubiquinone oxidoreductase subunit I
MFEVLRKSLSTGIVTTRYPSAPPEISRNARGRPEIDWAKWQDARPAASVCPTGAIHYEDLPGRRTASLDLAKCIFCGLCADVDEAIRMTNVCECAVASRADLIISASYSLKPDGTHAALMNSPAPVSSEKPNPGPAICLSRPVGSSLSPGGAKDFQQSDQVPALGEQLRQRIHQFFGRSLHIREVDAGSCNGCEIEIVGLNSPIYDLERFGIHFVASPRHADMLLVTGPVTRNMELALRKTYDAMPAPRLVAAVGACGCSGGIFGVNYATLGGVDAVIPVDVYIPGCPPNPYALLHGILLAIGRLAGPAKNVLD